MDCSFIVQFNIKKKILIHEAQNALLKLLSMDEIDV